MAVASNNRRTFIKLSLGGAGVALSNGCRSLFRRDPDRRAALAPIPSDIPLRLAFIGVGGVGKYHLDSMRQSKVQIAAICDVDQSELASARDRLAPQFPDLPIFQDYRVMFDNVKQLDAVIIATPDHGHAMQALRALHEGCHLYLETPAVHTLAELEILEREARKAGRLVLSGELYASHEKALRAREAFATGVTGDILQVHAWTNRPVWPQGGELPAGSDPVPPTLAWELWLAGAPPRPFKRFAYHKFNWRGWADFGGGALGDVGCQLLSFPYKALALEPPASVERMYAHGGVEGSYPKSSELRFICRSALQKNNVELLWYDGNRLPRAEIVQQVQATLGQLPGAGLLLVGTKGSWLVCGSESSEHYLGLHGSPRMTDFEKHDLWVSAPKNLPRTGTQQQLFLRALRRGKRYDFRQTAEFALNKTILIGTAAQRGEVSEEVREF